MKQQLLVEGALAMLSIVLVTFVMWYFVNRVSDQNAREEQEDDTTLPSYAQTVDLK